MWSWIVGTVTMAFHRYFTDTPLRRRSVSVKWWMWLRKALSQQVICPWYSPSRITVRCSNKQGWRKCLRYQPWSICVVYFVCICKTRYAIFVFMHVSLSVFGSFSLGTTEVELRNLMSIFHALRWFPIEFFTSVRQLPSHGRLKTSEVLRNLNTHLFSILFTEKLVLCRRFSR